MLDTHFRHQFFNFHASFDTKGIADLIRNSASFLHIMIKLLKDSSLVHLNAFTELLSNTLQMGHPLKRHKMLNLPNFSKVDMVLFNLSMVLLSKFGSLNIQLLNLSLHTFLLNLDLPQLLEYPLLRQIRQTVGLELFVIGKDLL